MLIINTGGTFNKQYNKLDGSLYISKDNTIIDKILSSYMHLKYHIQGIIYKDSLDIDDNDRRLIVQTILDTQEKDILIIHGTDTMNKTALFIDKNIKNKNIIITGAMKPYEIDKIEANINIAMSISFLQTNIKDGIYICMSGLIKPFKQIIKNKKLGIFENISNVSH
jgi:L-asparaginase